MDLTSIPIFISSEKHCKIMEQSCNIDYLSIIFINIKKCPMKAIQSPEYMILLPATEFLKGHHLGLSPVEVVCQRIYYREGTSPIFMGHAKRLNVFTTLLFYPRADIYPHVFISPTGNLVRSNNHPFWWGSIWFGSLFDER